MATPDFAVTHMPNDNLCVGKLLLWLLGRCVTRKFDVTAKRPVREVWRHNRFLTLGPARGLFFFERIACPWRSALEETAASLLSVVARADARLLPSGITGSNHSMTLGAEQTRH